MGFQESLKIGQEWENELFTACSEVLDFYRCSVAEQKLQGGDFYTYLPGDRPFYIECKHDKKAKQTGNLYIETSVSYSDGAVPRRLPGWAYKLPSRGFIAWKVDEDDYRLMENSKLEELLVTNGECYKRVNYTKSIPHSSGLLLPLKELMKYTKEGLVEEIFLEVVSYTDL